MITRNGAAPVLELAGVTAGYGRTTVLRDVDLVVPEGTVVALLGPNGAGKTTLLRTAAGFMRPSKGLIRQGGQEVTRATPVQRSRGGLCLVPEGRGVFRSLTVKENLILQVPPWQKDTALDRAYDAFPILKERSGQVAGTMSGGQQQMLALARAYLSRPKLVLLDEVSMGLAPRIVEEIFESLRMLAKQGVALLLVEQYIHQALGMADHVFLLNRGTVTFSGAPSELDQDALAQGYLGGAAA